MIGVRYEARVAAAAAGDAAERRRHLVPAAVRGRATRRRSEPLAWLAVCSLLVIPAAFLAGLLRSRLARGGVADLFGEIRTMRGAAAAGAAGEGGRRPEPRRGLPARGRLRGRRRRAGRRCRPRPVAPTRAFDGGALVYDAALDEDPGLVEVGRRRGGDRARARAARASESRATRQRLVAAGDAERRRLERDLHDGAQQRLVSVAIQLRLIEADIRRDPAAAAARVTSASGELARSLEELRELARGIHPAVLEHGLASALTSLAARSAVPDRGVVRPRANCPRPVELALYFVACEALANVGKYAQATAASVRLTRTRRRASRSRSPTTASAALSAARGSGLRGLAGPRRGARAATCWSRARQGAGTVVSAELPCAS